MSERQVSIGGKLRHARRLKHLRLKDLAARAGCSESLLSKIENNRAKPSLRMLHRIVQALDITIGALFDEAGEESTVVLRRGSRPVLETASHGRGRGVALEYLIAQDGSRLLQGAIHVIAPGGGSDGTIQHQGEELGYVLAGTLELTVGDRTYHLRAGDSFFFPSDLPHGYRNPGPETARVLWVNTPPTF